MAIGLLWRMGVSRCAFSAKFIASNPCTVILIVKTAAKSQIASYKNIFAQANHDFVMRTKPPDVIIHKIT